MLAMGKTTFISTTTVAADGLRYCILCTTQCKDTRENLRLLRSRGALENRSAGVSFAIECRDDFVSECGTDAWYLSVPKP